MKCPVCTGTDLKIAERQGVEIDYCPECRGVWLDRGELDKILERSFVSTNAYPQAESRDYQAGHNQKYYKEDHHGSHGYQQNGHGRRKSWLSELFD